MSTYEKIDLDTWVGKSVTLRGIAAEAHAGPVILVDSATGDFPIYIDGMESWETLSKLDINAGNEVEVTGKLSKEGGNSHLIAEDGTASHGTASATFHLGSATFMKAKPQPGAAGTS